MIRAPLNTSFPIVDKDGFMTPAFRDFLFRMGYQIPITGSGSPEGVVEAPLYSVYLDTSGGAGSIQYRKMRPSIGDDASRGWVLV